ncbi:MAG: CheY-like chemotaxis protein [Psychroserpens sp.]|jgi:CheY-like chemotaxis protein
MKLNYKILWLDDKMDDIIEDDYPSDILSHLVDQGFDPSIITTKNEKEFFENLDNSYDLILTDYHLNETLDGVRNGDEIVKEVRNQSIYTEIMFYSAQGDLVDTIKLDRITFFDTKRATGNIHFDKITEKAISLIDLTIKKFQHIVAMRGMIMHQTSSLDVIIEEILSKIIDEGDSDQIIKVIKKKYLNTLEDFTQRVTKSKDVPEILYSIGADHRIRGVLRNIDKSDLRTILNDYKKEIISVRNQFAHAVLDENTNTFKTKNGIIYDGEECKKIRINIGKHLNNLISLRAST